MNAEQDKQIKELEKSVTDAIQEKKQKNDFSFLENINDENLRYIQKFVEVEISRKYTKLSIPSLFVSAFGIAISLIAIGVAFFLVGISIDSVTKIVYPVGGVIIVFYGGWLFRMIYKFQKDCDKIEDENELMHEIILEIERKLRFKVSQ